MSFNFGQFKRTDIQLEDYFYSISGYSLRNDEQRNFAETTINEKCLHLNQPLNYEKTYLLSIQINSFSNTKESFILILKNSNDVINQQIINEIEVLGTASQQIDIIITPNTQGYDKIVFQLKRDFSDLSNPKQLPINIIKLIEIKNLLETSIGHSPLTKIGVQGPTGMLMAINGEPIRIGPSGIYEINNGYKIKSFGVYLSPNNSQYFILDYQY